jgi:hypothetical protein
VTHQGHCLPVFMLVLITKAQERQLQETVSLFGQ